MEGRVHECHDCGQTYVVRSPKAEKEYAFDLMIDSVVRESLKERKAKDDV